MSALKTQLQIVFEANLTKIIILTFIIVCINNQLEQTGCKDEESIR